MPDTYIVVCLDDEAPDTHSNPMLHYVLASRQIFVTRGVAESYAKGIARSRLPMVISGYWTDLRVRGE